ncbi:MAG: helix-turn-helix transcriptional regulator [Tannerellaceae bacterium]|nr:helix-turn-helix transcriptional regulator [Tannerellaceae bacterium]
MKKQVLLFAFLLPFLQVSGKTIEIPDSLLTVDHVYEYTFSDPEKAHRIIDLMRKQKSEPEFKLDITEGDLYSNQRRYKDALVYYTNALNSDSVQNNDVYYMELLNRMITCYSGLNDNEKNTEYIERLLDKATETGNREMKSIALFNMGQMIYYQADKSRGYQLIKEAIEEMKQSDYDKKYDNLRYNYSFLVSIQIRDDLSEDALDTLDAWEEVVVAEANDESYIEGLYEKEMKTLLAMRTVVLTSLNREEEADEVYKKWLETGKEYTHDDHMITPYLFRRKYFDEVIKIYSAREHFLYEQSDTITYHMRTVKRLLGMAYNGKEDYKQAKKYFWDLAVITDSLKVREQRSAALELATVYETHEKEIKLQEQTVHIKVRNILLFSAGIAIFFLLIILWRNVKHARTIRDKNKAMAATIEDLLVRKEELFEAKEELNALKAATDAKDPGPVIISETSGIDLPEDRLLFETLDNIVVREKLYLNPDLSREDLMKLIHVNKNRFAQILQQAAGSNTTTYINNKRLEYAAKLLKIHPEYTIAAIADLCGLPNVPTFNRLFKAKFGMTPTEFRDSL